MKKNIWSVTPDSLKSYVRWIYHRIAEQYKPIKNKYHHRRRVSKTPILDVDNRDVIYIVLDCLRDDRVSEHNDRDTTPYLSSAAEYTSGITAASWTYSSVPSILTGLYPHNHGAVFDVAYRNYPMDDELRSLRQDVFTLPELLGAAGYRSFCSTGIATAQLPLHGRFESIHIRNDAPAETIFDATQNWWRKYDIDNRFAYVHLGDLHRPLHPPSSPTFEGDGATGDWEFASETLENPDVAKYRKCRLRTYDNILREVDQQIKSFVEWLKSRGEFNNVLIIVTSDHGEEFWEWASFERAAFDDPRDWYGVDHGHALVPPVTDVPIYTLGEMPSPLGRYRSTIDVTPTLLNVLSNDLGKLEYQLDGDNWTDSPELDQAYLCEETAYGYNQQAVIKNEQQYIRVAYTNDSYLLSRQSKSQVDEFDSEQFTQHLPTHKNVGNEFTLTDQTEDQLAALGYTE